MSDHNSYDIFSSAASGSLASQRYRTNASSSSSLGPNYALGVDPMYPQSSFNDPLTSFPPPLHTNTKPMTIYKSYQQPSVHSSRVMLSANEVVNISPGILCSLHPIRLLAGLSRSATIPTVPLRGRTGRFRRGGLLSLINIKPDNHLPASACILCCRCGGPFKRRGVTCYIRVI